MIKISVRNRELNRDNLSEHPSSIRKKYKNEGDRFYQLRLDNAPFINAIPEEFQEEVIVKIKHGHTQLIFNPRKLFYGQSSINDLDYDQYCEVLNSIADATGLSLETLLKATLHRVDIGQNFVVTYKPKAYLQAINFYGDLAAHIYPDESHEFRVIKGEFSPKFYDKGKEMLANEKCTKDFVDKINCLRYEVCIQKNLMSYIGMATLGDTLTGWNRGLNFWLATYKKMRIKNGLITLDKAFLREITSVVDVRQWHTYQTIKGCGGVAEYVECLKRTQLPSSRISELKAEGMDIYCRFSKHDTQVQCFNELQSKIEKTVIRNCQRKPTESDVFFI